MSMFAPNYYEARGEQMIALRFGREASSDEVVARLLEAVRGTDLSLLEVFADGDRVYQFGGRNLAWSASASSWRAELLWDSPTLISGWQLEVFLKRAEIFLELPGPVRLELRGDEGDPRQDARGVPRARLGGPVLTLERPPTSSHERDSGPKSRRPWWRRRVAPV